MVVPSEFVEGKLTVFSLDDVCCVTARGKDLPWLLESGYVDAAIGSNINFEEYGGASLLQAANLNFGRCRLSLITKVNLPIEQLGRVCTRFPLTTKKILTSMGCNSDLVVLAGCNEIALFLGLADGIVDMVETGRTLQQLSLIERKVLRQVSHSIWVQRHRMDIIDELQQLLPSVVWDAGLPVGKSLTSKVPTINQPLDSSRQPEAGRYSPHSSIPTTLSEAGKIE
jgi:ATP phosphoribosyltransferase